MRMIATFLLVGVFCHFGRCGSSDASSSTAAPGTSPISMVAATSTGAVAVTTAGSTTQIPSAVSTGSTSANNVVGAPAVTTTTAAVATSTPAPTSTPAAAKSTAAAAETAATAGLTTVAPVPATTAKATVTETTASTVTFQTQPGQNVQSFPTSHSPESSSSSATMSPSTRTATETNMAGKVLSSASSLEASASPSQATHNPAGVTPVTQTPSPSSAATSVAMSQHAPVPGGKPTASSAAHVLPKTIAPTEKGGDVVKTAVFAKGEQNDEGNPVAFKVCEELMQQMETDKCTLEIDPNGTIKDISLHVNPALLKKLLEKHDQTNVPAKGPETDEGTEPPNNSTLIAILCSCGALLAMTAGFIAYITCHRRSYRKNQQHLTEEGQTVENGYHDNPTLEVMEPEMQEKKTTFARDYDCSIIPLDTKDDVPEEEDTHL